MHDLRHSYGEDILGIVVQNVHNLVQGIIHVAFIFCDKFRTNNIYYAISQMRVFSLRIS
jgi:hypothetical protein